MVGHQPIMSNRVIPAKWSRAALDSRISAAGGSAVFGDRYRALAILLILALFPLQFIGLDVGTTKVDLSNIAFLLFALSIVIGRAGMRMSTMYQVFIVAFLIVQISLFLNGETPTTRFVSGVTWIFAILAVYGRRKSILIDAKWCYYTVLAGSLLITATILFQLRILNIDRPPGTMAEPSTAGLALLSTAAALLISMRWSRSNIERAVFFVAAIVLVYISYAIRTTHIFSFAVALVIAAAFSRTLNIGSIIVISVIISGVYYVASEDTHYLSRIDVGAASSNLSLLSWLQGYDQMVVSLKKFPLTGAGLGATGYFDFYSEYSNFLFEANIADLNRFDAYSGFFRLTIETGPVFMAAVAYAIWLRLRAFWCAVGYGLLPRTEDASKYQVFLFTFALTLIVGIMLKEPTYSRSQVAVAALLFFIVPLSAWYRGGGSVSNPTTGPQT